MVAVAEARSLHGSYRVGLLSSSACKVCALGHYRQPRHRSGPLVTTAQAMYSNYGVPLTLYKDLMLVAATSIERSRLFANDPCRDNAAPGTHVGSARDSC